MKFFRQLVLALMIVPAIAWAQSSPSPDNTSFQAADAQAAAAQAAPSPVPDAAVEPPSLIPENILPAPAGLPPIPGAPDLQQLNSFFKQTSLGKAADEYRLHLKMAKLETRIRNDEDLHQLRAKALAAPTDLERRHRLKSYYQLYYGKLRSLADSPDLAAYLKAKQASTEAGLLQPRVRHETDEVEAAALAKAGAATEAAAPTPFQARASDALPR